MCSDSRCAAVATGLIETALDLYRVRRRRSIDCNRLMSTASGVTSAGSGVRSTDTQLLTAATSILHSLIHSMIHSMIHNMVHRMVHSMILVTYSGTTNCNI